MGNILTNIRSRFTSADMTMKLIFINVGVYVFLAFLQVFAKITGLHWLIIDQWFALPSDWHLVLMRPWTLITYSFLHATFWHLLFNMLWLYFFGPLFEYIYSARYMVGLYVLGELFGAAFFILMYNTIPYYMTDYASLVGASAAILALVIAVATAQPDRMIGLLLIGNVKFKYVAIGLIVMDVLLLTDNNGGGHLAHLGGALAGYLFVVQMKKRRDITSWINKLIDWIVNLSKLFKHTPHLKVSRGGKYGQEKQTVYNKHQEAQVYNEQKKEAEASLDQILDKVRKSGYDKLSDQEKRQLFDASKK
ncbi:MAG: rhomboid family intramembrane serine protease [Bacteroidaceae bacterium]